MDAHVDARTDPQLIEAYRTGDVGAMEALVRRHHDALMRFLIRLLGDRAAAEDVFQETFVQVHLSAGVFDTNRRFEPWLFTIAANKARDLMRRNQRRKALDLSSPIRGGAGDDGATYVDLLSAGDALPVEQLGENERDEAVQRAVSRMPLMLREVLLMAYFQRMSYGQIADALDIPLGTVKSRLHAAVAAFARQWQDVGRQHTRDRKGEDGVGGDETKGPGEPGRNRG